MKPIKIEIPAAPKYQRETSMLIRVSGDLHEAISKIAFLTRQPITQVANRLLAEALNAVELVETPLYNMNIKQNDPKEE